MEIKDRMQFIFFLVHVEMENDLLVKWNSSQGKNVLIPSNLSFFSISYNSREIMCVNTFMV